VSADVSSSWPTGDDIGSGISVGPVVRLMPREGWSPAAAFNHPLLMADVR
jgi:hypothetical protein